MLKLWELCARTDLIRIWNIVEVFCHLNLSTTPERFTTVQLTVQLAVLIGATPADECLRKLVAEEAVMDQREMLRDLHQPGLQRFGNLRGER